jgi:hypothetical protein
MWILLGHIDFIRINEYQMHEAANEVVCYISTEIFTPSSSQTMICYAVDLSVQNDSRAF